jgi:hypothetical protein
MCHVLIQINVTNSYNIQEIVIKVGLGIIQLKKQVLGYMG